MPYTKLVLCYEFKDFIQYNDIDLPELTSDQGKEVEKQKNIKAKIVQVLKFINDPELTKVSIWDLSGYKIDISNDHVLIEMTFTNAIAQCLVQ